MDAATINAPLGEIDQAIDDIVTGLADWPDFVTAPTLPSGSNVLLFFMDDLLQFRDTTGVTPITPLSVNYIQNRLLYASGLTHANSGWTSYPAGFGYATDETTEACIQITFSLGNTEPQINDVLVDGGGLGSYGTVAETPVVTGGSWAGGNAAGTILLKNCVQVFGFMSGLVDIQGGAANVLSVDSYAMSLPAGKYRCRAWGSETDSDGFQLRLYNVTTSQPLLYGSSEFASSVTSLLRPKSWLTGLFTLAQRSILSLDMYRAAASGDSYTAGRFPSWYNTGFDYDAIYCGVEFWRYPAT